MRRTATSLDTLHWRAAYRYCVGGIAPGSCVKLIYWSGCTRKQPTITRLGDWRAAYRIFLVVIALESCLPLQCSRDCTGRKLPTATLFGVIAPESCVPLRRWSVCTEELPTATRLELLHGRAAYGYCVGVIGLAQPTATTLD